MTSRSSTHTTSVTTNSRTSAKLQLVIGSMPVRMPSMVASRGIEGFVGAGCGFGDRSRVCVDGGGAGQDRACDCLRVAQGPNTLCVCVDLLDEPGCCYRKPFDLQGLPQDTDQQQRDDEHNDQCCDE